MTSEIEKAVEAQAKAKEISTWEKIAKPCGPEPWSRDVVTPERLRSLLELEARVNSPEVNDFLEGVKLEAEHQRQRWGEEHDANKHPAEWFQLLFYLFGKAARAFWDGNREKFLHHIVTGAAVCLNWHRQVIARWPAAGRALPGQEGGAP